MTTTTKNATLNDESDDLDIRLNATLNDESDDLDIRLNATLNDESDDLDIRLNAVKERLLEGGFSCVTEKDLEYITSNDLGVKPLITPLQTNKRFFENTVVADKIIGKAAAFLLILGGVQAVHGEIMSTSAIELFIAHNIYFTYSQEVLNILNRTKTDLCPMEKSVLNITDENAAFIAIENAIKILMAKYQKIQTEEYHGGINRKKQNL